MKILTNVKESLIKNGLSSSTLVKRAKYNRFILQSNSKNI